MSRTPYPAVMPIESLSNLIRIVRNGTISEERKDFAHDVWNVQGYVQSVVIGAPSLYVGAIPPTFLDTALRDQVAELVDLLDPIASSVAEEPVGSDLSRFLENLRLIGFVAALKQFLRDIFNLDK